jgi:hypothetical protein
MRHSTRSHPNALRGACDGFSTAWPGGRSWHVHCKTTPQEDNTMGNPNDQKQGGGRDRNQPQDPQRPMKEGQGGQRDRDQEQPDREQPDREPGQRDPNR